MRYILFTLIMFSFLLQSCDSTDSSSSEAEETTANIPEENNVVEESPNPYQIQSNSFFGVNVGDEIDATSLEKDVLKAGEGDFEIYNIKNEAGEKIGYVMPDPNEATLVGDIVIISTEAATTEGIKIGNTLEQLEAALGDITIHGSESEGYTSIEKDNIAYQLDTDLFTYEVDRSKIASDTKIKQIKVLRKKMN